MTGALSRGWEAPLVVAGGSLALAARAPSVLAVAVTALVGAAGALAGRSTDDPRLDSRLRWMGVTLVGTLPFLLASQWIMSNPLPRAALVAIAASVVAAVAEELFFRRLVYGWLLRWGVTLAIVGSAVLFTAVHIPIYGWGVLPLNLAAGLIFGWQRWVTGTWTAPAVTHVVANLLASL